MAPTSAFRYFAWITAIACFYSCSEKAETPLFTLIDASGSGLTFANNVAEDDTYNILDFEFVYNGGGVAVADFNGDGLEDLYFTGNTVNNALYLNRGDLVFEDVTKASNTAAAGRWCSGVTAADVNGDGLMDLYVSATVLPTAEQRANLLYINQGADGAGIPTFEEQAETYNLADTSHTTQAAFLDYDRDGDLDLYVVVNEMDDRLVPNRYTEKARDGRGRRNDRLYRNEGNGEAGHPAFTNVTAEAGINMDGYGLGISVCDLNQDGWPDIYVTNDYVTNDLLWINNQDGTFTDRAGQYFKHTAYSAMGNDVADLNNDGLDDVVALDMFPESNLRRKSMMPPNNYFSYINNDRFGYQYQYTRNVLQLNRGAANDSTGQHPNFSEVGRFAGVASTDWSWSALAADYDYDGDRDLLVSNGFPKDVTDHDFMDYNMVVGNIASREMLLPQIPTVKIANYGLRNDGGDVPSFTNATEAWGLSEPSFSNGAVYADLDNDGDLDYVTNNINGPCFLYRNNLVEDGRQRRAFLRVALRSEGLNTTAVGARVDVLNVNGDVLSTAYQNPVRGYLSSVSHDLFFGLDSTRATSLSVLWPRGEQRIYPIRQFDALQVLELSGGRPVDDPLPAGGGSGGPVVLTPLPNLLDAFNPHRDSLFIDFNVQPLLPHKLSEYGPGLAVGDVNGDGLDDLYRGGSHFYPGELLVQLPEGGFRSAALGANISDGPEEMGVLFFDADGDGDDDLYLGSGGSELSISSDDYLDRLLFNDGAGRFTHRPDALPATKVSTSCVRAADVDRDGDLDLFVGGRLEPARFPEPVNSYLLINDGAGTFSPAPAAPFAALGLVTDALFSDYNGDGWVDLLVAGQGMSIKVFANEEGAFSDATPSEFADHVGWWNGLTGADFDQDGDVDYLATNYGGNHLYHQNGADFVGMYGSDFDGNGGFDLLLSSMALAEDGSYVEYPHFQRKDTEKQLTKVKEQYLKHADFGQTTMADFLTKLGGESVVSLRANDLRSSWIENLGSGRFTFHRLPAAAQLGPLFGAVVRDVNADGYPDVVAIGNDYGAEVGGGRIDAMNGVVLVFDPAARRFEALSLAESGLFVPGNGRSAVTLRHGEAPLVVAAENQGETRAFGLANTAGRWYRPKTSTARLSLGRQDGSTATVECYYGSGFLSQSSRQVWLDASVSTVKELPF